jgi:hypothetical protein
VTIARIPFTQLIESRTSSTAKDARSVNCYFETRGGIRENVKRPGYAAVTLTPALTPGQAQGMYKCDSGFLWPVINNQVYKVSGAGTTATAGTLAGPVDDVYFAESANDIFLFLHNHTNGYVSTNNGNFALVDPTSVYSVTIDTGGSGYVNPSVTFDAAPGGGVTATGNVTSIGGVITGVVITNPGKGYLTAPGVTFVGAPGVNATGHTTLSGFPGGVSGSLAGGAVYLDGYTVVATKDGRIFNSDIDNPTLWNPLNFTKAQSDPDQIVAIIKHYNYIVVFGEWGTEFFYDAQVSPGSPFLRQDSYKIQIGCGDHHSVVQTEDSVIFVGKSKSHGRSVYMFQGMTPIPISTKYIENYLNALPQIDTSIKSFVFKISGHEFYVMNLLLFGITFVYDLTEKMWYQWTSQSGGIETNFNIFTATEFDNTVDTYTAGLGNTDGKIYNIRQSFTNDNGNSIFWRVITGRLDSGTMHRKFYKHGEVVGDKINAILQIRHSDDDYNTFSPYRNVNLNSVRSIIYQCGQARRRSWEFLCTDDQPLRLEAFEVDLEGGEQERDPQLQ